MDTVPHDTSASPAQQIPPPSPPAPGDHAHQTDLPTDPGNGAKPVRVAHVRHEDGDTHLRLQLRICNGRKTFLRSVTEPLDKIRYRLALLATQAAAGAGQPYNGNRTRKERNKHEQQCEGPSPKHTAVDVHFFGEDNQEVTGESLTVGDAMAIVTRLVIGSETYIVLRNQPQVIQITVMDPTFARIPVLPMPETEFCTADECTWRWYRVDADGCETLVDQNRIHVPREDDIGCRFRIECHAPSMHSCFARESAAEIMTSSVIEGPDRSVFAERQALAKQSASVDCDTFRVMSYNVLFDGYTSTMQAKLAMFPYAKREALEEAYRVQLVCEEIAETNADLVCLQEMGCNIFHAFFEPMLAARGFQAMYTGKTGSTHEGCAVLVRRDCFDVVDHFKIDLSSAILECNDPQVDSLLTDSPELHKALDKIPSVAQVLLLNDKRESTRRILLVNTHLFYREDGDMIRLLQAVALIRTIETLRHQVTQQDSDHRVAIVFCGDLNAFPDTATTRFLLDGKVDHTHRHWQEVPSFVWERSKDLAPTMDSVAKSVTPGVLRHELDLFSACGIPEFTNFAGTFVGTLDYILIARKQLRIARCFPLFTREHVTKEVALPSSVFPSDHISLIADVEWI